MYRIWILGNIWRNCRNIWLNWGKLLIEFTWCKLGETFDWIGGKISLKWGNTFIWISLIWIEGTFNLIEGNIDWIGENIWLNFPDLNSGKRLTELWKTFDWIKGIIWLNWGKHLTELGETFDWIGKNIWLNFQDLNWRKHLTELGKNLSEFFLFEWIGGNFWLNWVTHLSEFPWSELGEI